MPQPTLPPYASAWILQIEGGEGNDPTDRGGHTNFGISKKAHPDVDIAALTRERALEIYARDYWRAVRGDELPKGLDLAVFDMAVNSGVRRSVETLQRALVTLGLDDVRADGLMGPATLHGAKLAIAENPAETLATLLSLRALFFTDVVLQDRLQRKFMRGWCRRLFLLQVACLGLVIERRT